MQSTQTLVSYSNFNGCAVTLSPIFDHVEKQPRHSHPYSPSDPANARCCALVHPKEIHLEMASVDGRDAGCARSTFAARSLGVDA